MFKNSTIGHISKFNSSMSSKILEDYENLVVDQILSASSHVPSRTFAPSSFRCDRRSWFRLRGVDPDVTKTPDRILNFSANLGTACHKIMQNNLKNMYGDAWINIFDYAHNNFPNDWVYNLNESEDGFECQVELISPYPIKFSVDGLLFLDGKYYLVEIKTSDYSSWKDLTDPKKEHIDQVKLYASLLKVKNIIMIYQDRQYGDIKCYELDLKDYERDEIFKRLDHVLDCVDTNIAPKGLPVGDSWCTSNMCQYYEKCQEYGR